MKDKQIQSANLKSAAIASILSAIFVSVEWYGLSVFFGLWALGFFMDSAAITAREKYERGENKEAVSPCQAEN